MTKSASDTKAALQFSVPWSVELFHIKSLAEHKVRQAGVSPHSHTEALTDPEGYPAHRDGLWNRGFELDDTL